MSYQDLEPFYDRAEYDLGVSGQAGNVKGQKVAGGNPFEAPRQRDYPLPPLQVDQAGAIFESAAHKLGYHPFSSPRAIISADPIRTGRPAPIAASANRSAASSAPNRASLVTKLPEADATGNFKLITGAMCYRVNSDNAGKVTGVSYYGPDRSDNTIEADIVIVAPFIYDNTRLMLLSKTEELPTALPIRAGRWASTSWPISGRGCSREPWTTGAPTSSWDRGAQRHSLDDFNDDNFDHAGLGFIRGAQDLGRSRRSRSRARSAPP